MYLIIPLLFNSELLNNKFFKRVRLLLNFAERFFPLHFFLLHHI